MIHISDIMLLMYVGIFPPNILDRHYYLDLDEDQSTFYSDINILVYLQGSKTLFCICKILQVEVLVIIFF